MHYVNCIYIDSKANDFFMLFVTIAGNCKNSCESDKLLFMREIVSVTMLLLVTVWYTRLKIVLEIDDELGELSAVDYDEVSEVGEADE